GPALLAGTGFDQVVVATYVVTVPPAGLDALRPHENACRALMHRQRLSQQPARPLHGGRHRARLTAGTGLPCTLGAVIGLETQAMHRIIPQPCTQALAQL